MVQTFRWQNGNFINLQYALFGYLLVGLVWRVSLDPHVHVHLICVYFEHKRTHVITYKTHTVSYILREKKSFFLSFISHTRRYICCCCCYHKNIKLWNDSGISYREWGDTKKRKRERPFYYGMESRSHISGIVIYKGRFPYSFSLSRECHICRYLQIFFLFTFEGTEWKKSRAPTFKIPRKCPAEKIDSLKNRNDEENNDDYVVLKAEERKSYITHE